MWTSTFLQHTHTQKSTLLQHPHYFNTQKITTHHPLISILRCSGTRWLSSGNLYFSFPSICTNAYSQELMQTKSPTENQESVAQNETFTPENQVRHDWAWSSHGWVTVSVTCYIALRPTLVSSPECRLYKKSSWWDHKPRSPVSVYVCKEVTHVRYRSSGPVDYGHTKITQHALIRCWSSKKAEAGRYAEEECNLVFYAQPTGVVISGWFRRRRRTKRLVS